MKKFGFQNISNKDLKLQLPEIFAFFARFQKLRDLNIALFVMDAYQNGKSIALLQINALELEII